MSASLERMQVAFNVYFSFTMVQNSSLASFVFPILNN